MARNKGTPVWSGRNVKKCHGARDKTLRGFTKCDCTGVTHAVF